MNSIAQAVDLVKQTLRPLEEMDFSLHGDHKLRDGDGDERFVGLMDSKQVSKQICLSIWERMSWYYH